MTLLQHLRERLANVEERLQLFGSGRMKAGGRIYGDETDKQTDALRAEKEELLQKIKQLES